MAKWLVHATVACVLVVCFAPGTRVLSAGVEVRRQHVGPGSVAAGRGHSVMATPEGRVSAWGRGGRGQIGDGSLIDRWLPTAVPVDGIVAVAAGAAHTVAVTTDGGVYAWGANTFGAIGDGTRKRRAQPVRVRGLTNVVAVAAGGAHSLALTADGRVFAWGWNRDGQLGVGNRMTSLIPIHVRDLPEVVAIAAGDTHSLAVTRGRRVFAWGNNQFSRLGDGTSRDRMRPVALGLNDVVSVAGGDAHSLALLRNGSVLSWGRGRHGELGTGSTRVASRPTLIPGLRATAIAAGGHFSAAIQGDGHVVAWGANESGQLGDDTTTRRLQPVVVHSVADVAAIALGDAHAIAVTASGDVRTWGAGAFGQLGNGATLDRPAAQEIISDIPDWGVPPGEDEDPPEAPTISPAGGIYPQPPLITLGGVRPTDLIRFTLDGSEPTETSAIYAAPFTLAASSTVTTRSYSATGEPSLVRTESFTIDTVAPSIEAIPSPPLRDGWMTTPVTVTFQCADNLGIAVCPNPVTVANDGYAQRISGTAVDLAGHQATVSVLVNLDLNPPELTITEPADQAAIEADEVEVTGRAIDLASGLVDGRCNGAPAQIVDGLVRCSVHLHPGRNDIILHAIDGVGHNASAAISVMRTGVSTSLTLTPATRAMAVNESATLSLRDGFGVVVDRAAWSTSDATIVVLSESEPPVLTAMGIGSVTITAEKNGARATAEIEVSAALAAGATRWTLPPLPGLTGEAPLFTNRVDPSVPHMFTVETEQWGEATLRAVNADGEVLWQQHSPGIPLMGDSFGGVVTGVLSDVNQVTDMRAYLRLGGGSVPPWRYQSPGALERPAQAPDGTIYAVEYLLGGLNRDGDEIWDKYAVVIDGSTGRLISRTLFPREVDEFTSERDGAVLPLQPPIVCRTLYYDYAPDTLGPVVGSDGRGYFVVRRHALRKRAECIEPFQQRPDRTITMGLDLVIVSATEAPETVTLFSSRCDGPAGTTLPCDVPVRAFQLMPDGIGGTLVTWQRGTHMVGPSVFLQRSLTRVDAEGATDDRPVDPQFWLELMGQAGTALTFDDRWRAIDVTSGSTTWASVLPGLAPLAARPDGGLAMLDMRSGALKFTNALGEVEGMQSFGLDWGAVQFSGDWIGLRNGQLTAVVGDFADATRWSALRGNAQGQLTARRPGMGITLKSQKAKEPLPIYHTAIKIAPINQNWLETWYSSHPELQPRRDLFGNLFIMLGAGLPNGQDTASNCLIPGLDRLVSDTNRVGDLEKIAFRWLELPVSERNEAATIQRLLDWHERYADNAPYACFPEDLTGFYNSNSYVRSLLRHAQVPHDRNPPRSPSPGWLTIIPTEFFRER